MVAATIAQVGAIGNQGGLSNLERLEAHDPPAQGRKRPDGGGSLFLISRKGYGHCSGHHCTSEHGGCYHYTD